MADKIIRIGTRDSELALWQAHTVEKKLNDLGYKTEIVAVKAQGILFLTNLFMNHWNF
jgi:hydroxymethylbilane synthase